MATETLLGKMESLISQPLLLAVQANGNMALSQIQFMLDHCFVKQMVDGAESYSPKMVGMLLTRNVITPATDEVPKTDNSEAVAAKETTIKQVTSLFNLPFLTIIPINSLVVDTLEVHVDFQNLYAYENNESEDSSYSLPDNASIENIVVNKCTLNIHVGQLPLPKGVNIIIEAFSQSISPINLLNG